MNKGKVIFKRGFTLIELLVVIAIIGILSSVVLVNVQASRNKSRYSQVMSQLEEIEKALEFYYSVNGKYPGDVGPGGVPPGLVPTYLAKWPAPPCPGWTYDYQNWDSGNRVLTSVYTELPWLTKGERCHHIAPGFLCPNPPADWVNKIIICER